MSDDIVTRLRRVTEVKMYNDLTDELEVVATFTKSDDSLEAADEIERLRAELDKVKLTARKQLTKLEVEIIRWRRVADAFALAHRKRYGLDGAWDPENLAYDRAVKESQREFS